MARNMNDVMALRGAGNRILGEWERVRDDAKFALREVIANATRQLDKMEKDSAGYIQTDWIERPAAKYHDAQQQMVALDTALTIVLGMADQLEKGDS